MTGEDFDEFGGFWAMHPHQVTSLCHNRVVSFYSVYRHGFIRVAACTLHTTIADPATNAEAVLSTARECHDEGVGLAVFPELTLTGYSIDDILLQDTLLDAVEVALGDIVAASTELLPVLVVGAPLRFRNRVYNTAAVIHRGVVLGVVPKSYLPTYREFYERRHFAPGDDVHGSSRSARSRRRSVPTCCSARPTSRTSCCTSRSVRTCGCRCRPAPERRWPVRPCWRICRAARSPLGAPRTVN